MADAVRYLIFFREGAFKASVISLGFFCHRMSGRARVFLRNLLGLWETRVVA